MVVVKHFNHGQIVSDKPKFFNFDISIIKNVFDKLGRIWPYLRLNGCIAIVKKLDLVHLLSFLGRRVFEKDLGFVNLPQDFENTPEKLNFRICGHLEFVIIVFQKDLSQPLLLSVITTLVNTKVHQLTDMTDPLSTPGELSPKRRNLLIKESFCSQ